MEPAVAFSLNMGGLRTSEKAALLGQMGYTQEEETTDAGSWRSGASDVDVDALSDSLGSSSRPLSIIGESVQGLEEGLWSARERYACLGRQQAPGWQHAAGRQLKEVVGGSCPVPPHVLQPGYQARPTACTLPAGAGRQSPLAMPTLLCALRARGSGVLADLSTEPTQAQCVPFAPLAPVKERKQNLVFVPSDALRGSPAKQGASTPLAMPKRTTLSTKPVTARRELDPLKVSLPAGARSSLALLDPNLPAKKMPKFAEFADERPRQFDPSMPLKKRVPASLLEDMPRTTFSVAAR